VPTEIRIRVKQPASAPAPAAPVVPELTKPEPSLAMAMSMATEPIEPTESTENTPVEAQLQSQARAHVQPQQSQMKQLAQLLLECEDSSDILPNDMLQIINDESLKIKNRLTNEAGQFLMRIQDTKHKVEEVEKLVDIFPSSLSYRDGKGRLPVQCAVYNEKSSASFIPLLAEKGQKLNVGGKDMRGGLLCELPDVNVIMSRNVIQCLAYLRPATNGDYSDEFRCKSYDQKMLEVLQSLHSSPNHLLAKEDISKMELLEKHANHEGCNQRFAFLADLDPKGLESVNVYGTCLHNIVKHRDSIDTFEMVLKAIIKHYPGSNGVGSLFQKHYSHGDETACEAAIKKYGKMKCIACIKRCIHSGNGQHSILHSVVKHIPQYEECFTGYYSEERDQRNQRGRLLSHAKIAMGNKKEFLEDPAFFTRMITEEELKEVDPVTGLYPFLLAAVNGNCDLTGINKLTRRNVDWSDAWSCTRKVEVEKKRVTGEVAVAVADVKCNNDMGRISDSDGDGDGCSCSFCSFCSLGNKKRKRDVLDDQTTTSPAKFPTTSTLPIVSQSPMQEML